MSAKLITFYSFKGGVGRTQALANVAVGLANRGKNVIVVDMDLESPGLHAFFHHPEDRNRGPFRDEDLAPRTGLIDFVEQCARLPEEEPSVLEMLVPCTHPRHDAGKGWIRLLPAGRFSDDYPERMASFSWETFYNQKRGYQFMELLRERLIESGADYVLVDSRTGMTDVANICTFQLPDIVVVLFALHEQGLQGAYRVAQAIGRAQEEEGANTRVRRLLLVPSRVEETGELELRNRWLAKVRDRLAGCGELLADQGQRLPYLPQIAYGEQIVVDPGEPDILSQAYGRLIEAIVGDAERATRRPPPSKLSFEEIRRDAKRIRDSIAALVVDIEKFAPATRSIEEIQRWAHGLLRQRDERLQEIRRLEETLVALARGSGVPVAAVPESEAERPETVAGWRELEVRLHLRTEEQIAQVAAAKRMQIEERLRKAAEQDKSLLGEAVAKLAPLLERGEFETIDDQLPILEEELARQGLEALLRNDALERARLVRSRSNPDEWLDERLDRVLAEGSQSATVYATLRNLLRLRIETLREPSRLHWSAYEVLCSPSSIDPHDSGYAFDQVGSMLWTLEWKRLFEAATAGELPPVLAGQAARENLERMLVVRPEKAAPLGQIIAEGLLRIWSEGKRNAVRSIITRSNEDAGLQLALAKNVRRSESARAIIELLATWLRSTAPTGYQPDILQAFVEALVEDGSEAEAFYLLEALHALGVSVAQLRGVVDVAFLLRAIEAGQDEIVGMLLADKEIREAVASVAAGKALLVLIAWQPRHFPRFAVEMRQLVVHSLHHAGPSLSRELAELVENPLTFNLADARRAHERVRSIRDEYQTKRFFGSWDSSRHYETDFHELVHGRLDQLLFTTEPRDVELERQSALWDGDAWIDASYRAQKQKGLRTSFPEGSARRSILQTFDEVREKVLDVASVRPSSGQPSLGAMFAEEQVADDRVRALSKWITDAAGDRDVERILAPRLAERIVALARRAGPEECIARPEPGWPRSFARFPLEADLFKKSALLFDLEDRGRSDPKRYLETLLAYSTGDRGLPQAAWEYLERGDVLRAARSLQEMSEEEIADDLCAAVDEAWAHLQEKQRLRFRQIAERSSEVRAAGITWDSSTVLDDSLSDAERLLSQVPKGTGEPLRRELARLDNRVLAKLDDVLGYAALALEEGQSAVERYQQERLGRIREAKRSIDERLDDLLLQVNLDLEHSRALEQLRKSAGDCLSSTPAGSPTPEDETRGLRRGADCDAVA